MPFPLLLGIPRLLDDAFRAPLVEMIGAGKVAAAAVLALQWPSKTLSNRVERRLMRALCARPALHGLLPAFAPRLTGRRLLEHSGSFVDLVRAITGGYVADWLVHRFSAGSYLPLLALTALLKPDDRVLEIGAGVGHSTFALTARVPAARIVCVDSVFAHLAVARLRMVPGATFVCSDAARCLPFPDGRFDVVSMSDTFHFVPDGPRLARDVARVLASAGRVVLSHVHNGLIADRFAGQARSPADYLACFPGFDARLFADDSLIAGHLGDGVCDLRARADPAMLAEVAALSLVADRDGASFALWPAPMLPRRTPGAMPILNPLLGFENGRLRRRSDVAPLLSNLFRDADVVGLPDDHRSLVDAAMSEANPALSSDLLRRLILVNAPDGYV